MLPRHDDMSYEELADLGVPPRIPEIHRRYQRRWRANRPLADRAAEENARYDLQCGPARIIHNDRSHP